MKQIWAALGLCLSVVASAAEGWGTDFEQGLATAKAEGRLALVEFTGSDWCPPCMHVRSKILPSEAFVSFAKANNFVLVELDFPQDETKVTPEQRKVREEISERYGIDGFPTMLVTDGLGQPYGKIVGAEPQPEAYIARLQEAVDAKKAFDEKVAAAASLSGVERAAALVEALKGLPEDCRAFHTGVIEDIKSNDPEDTTGLVKGMEQAKLLDAQVEELGELVRTKMEEADGDLNAGMTSARASLLELINREDILPRVRLLANVFVAQSYMVAGEEAEALRYMDAAIAADPEFPDMEQLKVARAALEKRIQAGEGAEK